MLNKVIWFCISLLTMLSFPMATVAESAIVTMSDVSVPQVSSEVVQPKSNEEIRQWYSDTVDKIPDLNEQWIAEGVSVEERAKRAHDIRHDARVKAREMMQNKQEVADLQARDAEKYGNPDGPTFEYLVEKNRQKGLEGDAVYEAIIGSANRTNREYNEKYGVKKENASQ